MRVVCFGKVTQDEMIYVTDPVVTGGNAQVREVETVLGGMVTWAGRTVLTSGHTPVLVGCGGASTPPQHLGDGSEDYIVRDGDMYHIRVIVDPNGQRSFLAPSREEYPTYRIPLAATRNIAAVLLDGYSILLGRNATEASSLVHTARAVKPNIPIVITLPVAQKLSPTNISHLVNLLDDWDNVIVSGGQDEHDLLPLESDASWTSVVTTGFESSQVVVHRGGSVIHVEPVELVENPRNTNGAGDVFAAGLAMGLGNGLPFGEIIRSAHVNARAHVSGVAPVLAGAVA